MLHDVVDGHAGVGEAAGRVDVEEDVLAGSVLSRYRISATSRLAIWSSTSWPRNTIRSFSSSE